MHCWLSRLWRKQFQKLPAVSMRFLCPHYKRYTPVRKMEANAFPTSTTCQVLNWKKMNKYELLLCGKTLILHSKQKQSKIGQEYTWTDRHAYFCLLFFIYMSLCSHMGHCYQSGFSRGTELTEWIWKGVAQIKGRSFLPTRAGLKLFLPTSKEPD